MKKFFNKMKGQQVPPPRATPTEIFFSVVGGFIGMSLISLLGLWTEFTDLTLFFYIGSFGASAVLVFGIPMSLYAQPRNMVGGQFLAAITGVTVYQLMPELIILAMPVAVSATIAVMHVTRTLHPPAGATALLAIIGSDQVHNLGYIYAFSPVLIGVLTLLLVALIINNIPKTRQYPQFWW